MENIKYYYCNYNVFESILKNKQLWLTSIWDLNDSNEIEWLYENIFPKVFDIQFEDSTIENQEVLLALKNELEHKIYKNSKVFIMCFSDHRDLLSQWRGYADDGKGFSIGIDLSKISNLASVPFSNVDFNKSFGYSSVIYDYKTQINIVYSFLKDIFENVPLENRFLYALYNLALNSVIFKNDYYAEECETRLIFNSTTDKGRITNFDSNGKMTGPFLHQNKYGYSYHVRFDLTEYLNLNCIKEIVLGPKNNMDIEILGALLEENGFKNIEISKSKGTYR